MTKNSLQILIASDSFKGSASSLEVAKAIELGIRRKVPGSIIQSFPIADGGEGTVEAIVEGAGGSYESIEVTGPIGERVLARYGMLNQTTAVVEVASTSGLTLMDDSQRNPYIATSYGLGEIINQLVQKGVKHFYIGLGGSGCNDGGTGMLQALGGRLLDKEGRDVPFGVNGLKEVATIQIDRLKKTLEGVTIEVLSDVQNPLTGLNGATYIYGRQKGVTEADLPVIDGYMKQFENLVRDQLQIDLSKVQGGGAAGGIGAALWGFAQATIHSGIEKVLELIDIEQRIQEVDLVITGEGSIDSQSLYGKAPIGIANIAKKYNKPVIAIVGSSEDDQHEIYQSNIDLIIGIINRPMGLEEAMEKVEELLENAGENAIRSYLLGQ